MKEREISFSYNTRLQRLRVYKAGTLVKEMHGKQALRVYNQLNK